MSKRLSSTLMLLLAAIIWGVAFVAQSKGGTLMSAYTFTAIRFLVAALAMVPAIMFLDRFNKSAGKAKTDKRMLWKAGTITGLMLGVASLLQQLGITFGTGAGKAGFLSVTYIVIIPLISLIVFKKKVNKNVWIGVVMALVGLYLLCITDGFSFQFSDMLVFLCAFAFAVQIMTVSHFAPLVDAARMAAIEFLVCGSLSAVLMIFFDIIPNGISVWAEPLMHIDAWIPLLYAAILSSSVAYTLQVVGQKNVNPTVASLMLSTESVFAAVAGWMLMGQVMSEREIIGSIFVMIAVIIAQLPAKRSIAKAASGREKKFRINPENDNCCDAM